MKPILSSWRAVLYEDSIWCLAGIYINPLSVQCYDLSILAFIIVTNWRVGEHEVRRSPSVSSHQMAHLLMSLFLWCSCLFISAASLSQAWKMVIYWDYRMWVVLQIGEKGAKHKNALLVRKCSMPVCVVIVIYCSRTVEHFYSHCQKTSIVWDISSIP